MKKNKTNQTFEFKFVNPYTEKEEVFDYYLDSDDMVAAIKVYADYHGVELDGTDTSVFNLFSSLDSGKYEYINEVFDKICDNEYVQEKLIELIKDKAFEEFKEEAQEKFEYD